MGTLLAFTSVAVSVLILRYVPPDEVPLQSSLQKPIDSLSPSQQHGGTAQEVAAENSNDSLHSCNHCSHLLDNEGTSIGCPLLQKHLVQGTNEMHSLVFEYASLFPFPFYFFP